MQVKRWPVVLRTFGDHLRARRLALGLKQREVAVLIGVSQSAIQHWEDNSDLPNPVRMPSVVRFLGYDPTDKSQPLSR